jgi:hypothetical protein
MSKRSDLSELLRFRPTPNPPDPATLMELAFLEGEIDTAARGKVLQAYLDLQLAHLSSTAEYLKSVRAALGPGGPRSK